MIDIIYELKDELCLVTACGSYDLGGERMLQRERFARNFAKSCDYDSNNDGGQ